MTTFNDDFVQLHLILGVSRIPLIVLDLEWPPPERLVIELDDNGDGSFREAVEGDTGVLVRTSMSGLSDEARAGTEHIARGARYDYEDLL
ncbi:MAG: hypothetical protein ABFR89_02600 [Actinomycetota bacterium]